MSTDRVARTSSVGPPDGLRAGKARPLGWKQLRRKEPGSKRVCVCVALAADLYARFVH